MKRLIIDLDNTICFSDGDYSNAKPNYEVIDKVNSYKQQGFEIVISTSRNMRTYRNNIGKINIHTLPVIIDWLEKHNVLFDEILVGKPWCGYDGFYVDDKAIRPNEFVNLSYEQIMNLISD